MFRNNKTFPVITAIFFTLILNFSLTAQELPVEDLKPDKTVIDTIDEKENLLDSNVVYKKQFDSLSKDGEWVEIEKSEFLQELTESTGEDFDFDESSSTTKIIYVWRPYVVETYWNPYYNGSWVFTNFGWVWNSYYSWGWAPYNYGRWYCSSYYGWVWFPGNCWAPNYVSWRNCGNYVGWYPTCPVVTWRGRGTQVYTNHLFAYNPQNWVFVNKKDFTKKIDKTRIVKSEDNSKLLKKSEKVNVLTYKDPSMAKFKYKGPDAISLAKESGVRVTPQIITAGNPEIRSLNIKNENTFSTGSDNTRVSNTKSDLKKNNNSNSNSKNKKETTNNKNTKKYNSGDSKSDYKKESNERSVKKDQNKKSKEKTKIKTTDSKKEKGYKNSNKESSKSGKNSTKKSKSSTRSKGKRIR